MQSPLPFNGVLRQAGKVGQDCDVLCDEQNHVLVLRTRGVEFADGVWGGIAGAIVVGEKTTTTFAPAMPERLSVALSGLRSAHILPLRVRTRLCGKLPRLVGCKNGHSRAL